MDAIITELERILPFSFVGEGGADHIAPTMCELERHVPELNLLAETSGSEGGKAQEMRVPAVRYPLFDARPV